MNVLVNQFRDNLLSSRLVITYYLIFTYYILCYRYIYFKIYFHSMALLINTLFVFCFSFWIQSIYFIMLFCGFIKFWNLILFVVWCRYIWFNNNNWSSLSIFQSLFSAWVHWLILLTNLLISRLNLLIFQKIFRSFLPSCFK